MPLAFDLDHPARMILAIADNLQPTDVFGDGFQDDDVLQSNGTQLQPPDRPLSTPFADNKSMGALTASLGRMCKLASQLPNHILEAVDNIGIVVSNVLRSARQTAPEAAPHRTQR